MTAVSKPSTSVKRDGRYQNPWLVPGLRDRRFGLLKWQWQRWRDGVPPTPHTSQFPRAVPAAAQPRAQPSEVRITWLGHATFLLQLGSINLLTDPMLTKRASPFAWFGPARVVPPPLTVKELPPIDAVLITHDHYDHLDEQTCVLLIERFGSDLPVLSPLGYAAWFAKRGGRNVIERDWWQEAEIAGLRTVCLPAQHWTRRWFRSNRRLWCSWLMRDRHSAIYFCGDSGYGPAFGEIAGQIGAPDIAILPIGAYEPRWFMKPAHMNPEEAVQAHLDLGATHFVASHWGTFRLTDEPMLEPPVRVRSAWLDRGLNETALYIPKHGETMAWRAPIRSTT